MLIARRSLRQALADSRKISQASSQDSDSNALESEKGGPRKYQPARLVPSRHGPNELESRRRRPAGLSHSALFRGYGFDMTVRPRHRPAHHSILPFRKDP